MVIELVNNNNIYNKNTACNTNNTTNYNGIPLAKLKLVARAI